MKNYLQPIGKFLSLRCAYKATSSMKYNELAKKLRKIGCVDTGEQTNGHPLWYSPVTRKTFKMSNHGSQEVPQGTLNQIMKDAGLK